MADQATANYLDENVGPALAKALAALSTAQPSDAVAFLGNWLQQYADTEDANVQRNKEQALLDEERSKKRAEQKEKEGRMIKRLQDLSAIDKARDELKAKYDEVPGFQEPSYWTDLIDVSQRVTGANAVYIGAMEEGEGGGVRYDYASTHSDARWNHSFMTDKTLPAGTGVTTGVWTAKPPDDQVGVWKSQDAADNDSRTYFPVYIPCVTDCEQIHYFQMTRLGSYLAVPIVYSSYYTDDALEKAKVYEAEVTKRAEDEEKRKEEEANLPEGEALEPVAELEPLKLELPDNQQQKMVLCIDTLGTNVAIDVAKIPDVQMLCDSIGHSKRRAEETQICEQARFMLDEKKAEQIDAELQELQQLAATKLEGQQKEERDEIAALEVGEESAGLEALLGGKDLKAFKEGLLELKYAYLRAKDVVVQENMQKYILELTSWVVIPKDHFQAFTSTLAACALLLKFRKESVYMKKKEGLHWDKLKELLAPELFDTIARVDVDGVRQDLEKEQKLSFLKGLVYSGEYDEAKAGELSHAFRALFVYVRAAFDYRVAEVQFRAKQKEARIQAIQNAEEGANVEPWPAEQEDIDFDGINEVAPPL